MELRHLRYFVAVAEEQNVTRAAARLHVSQPPLSRQVHDLEEELGVALFERTPKALRLTEAGRLFLEEARAILSRTDDAVRAVKAIASGSKGELHVGFAPSLTVEILPRALRQFQDQAPGIKVVLHDLSTGEMLEGLHNKKLHFAMMIELNARSHSGLVVRRIHRYPVCVAIHPAHALARARSISLAQLTAERLVAYARAEYPEYNQWLQALFSASRNKPQIAEEHESATALIAAVEAGRGVALVPQSFSCFAGERLKLKLLKPPPPPFVVTLVRRGGVMTAACEQFSTAVEHSSNF
jgi:DNA-binding transcriptional LysR family regulator